MRIIHNQKNAYSWVKKSKNLHCVDDGDDCTHYIYLLDTISACLNDIVYPMNVESNG